MSKRTPTDPAAALERVSTPRVTSSVFAPGNFSTTSSRPGRRDDRVADQRLVVLDDRRDVGQPQRAVGALDRDLARAPGRRHWQDVLDAEPLVRRVDEAAGARRRASRNVSGDTNCALPAVSMTCSSDTPCSRSCAGSTCTCSWRSRWPQIGDVGHPGTPISLGRIVQRASTDMLDRASVVATTARPSSPGSSRTAAGASAAACETCGSAWAWVSRSCTSWRALEQVGARLEDHDDRRQPGTDSERIVLGPRRRSAGRARAAR